MKSTLQQRMSELEQRVEQMERRLQADPPHDWRSTIGMFAGDEVMERICQAALDFREADRKRAKRRPATKRRRKS